MHCTRSSRLYLASMFTNILLNSFFFLKPFDVHTDGQQVRYLDDFLYFFKAYLHLYRSLCCSKTLVEVKHCYRTRKVKRYLKTLHVTDNRPTR